MTEDEWILRGIDAIQPGDVIGIVGADGTVLPDPEQEP